MGHIITVCEKREYLGEQNCYKYNNFELILLMLSVHFCQENQ